MTNWMKRIIASGSSEATPPDEVEEWFTPRTDGVYEGGPEAYRYLHFTSAGSVGVDDGATASPPSGRARTTTYTGAGRFSLAAPFQRPVVFVVLGHDTDTLTVRITDTDTLDTAEHRYVFRPGTT